MDAGDTFRTRVVHVVADLEAGEVVTYGEVAALAGRPGAARAVGALLAANADPALPWWRVVNAAGRLAPGHETRQASHLRREGVAVRDGRVVGFASRASRSRRRARGSS